jgi:hypothetical protein
MRHAAATTCRFSWEKCARIAGPCEVEIDIYVGVEEPLDNGVASRQRPARRAVVEISIVPAPAPVLVPPST